MKHDLSTFRTVIFTLCFLLGSMVAHGGKTRPPSAEDRALSLTIENHRKQLAQQGVVRAGSLFGNYTLLLCLEGLDQNSEPSRARLRSFLIYEHDVIMG